MLTYRQQVKSICILAWPAVIQEALNVVVTYVDTAMVGALGASASAAVGLTGSAVWLVTSLCIAIGIGILALIAQAKGANNLQKVQRVSQQALFITLLVGSLLTIICLSVSPVLPIWLGGDITIQSDASSYFFIISIPLLFRGATLILSSSLRGVGDMKSPLLINLSMNLINIILNFIFIYPTRDIFGITVFGAGLGVQGAAIASALSFFIGGLFMFRRYVSNPIFNMRETGIHFHKKEFKECFQVGTPVMLERSVICFGHIFFASLVAKLGVVPFAAHTIALQAEQAFYIPGYGFQSATSTLVGCAVGERDKQKVKQITTLICSMIFILMVVAGIILFVFAEGLMSIFTPDPQVIKIGTTILRIVSISEPIYGILVILEGTFNGMGDNIAPFVYSIITMWGIRILGSWVMIHIFSLGISAVWIMMVLDNSIRCLFLLQRFVRKKWLYRLQI